MAEYFWPPKSGGSSPDAVMGPASSTDNAVARFDGTTGKMLQNSPVIIDDSGNMSGIGNISLSGLVDGRDVSVDGTTLDNFVASKAQPNGLASLDAAGQIPSSQIPALAITETFVVASQAAQTALTAQIGDVAVRTDLNETYILQSSPASVFANWVKLLTPTDSVLSVNGQTGAVNLTTTNISEGTNLYFTDERAQDAVGTILTDSSSIDFTYNDAANQISAVVLPSGIDKNSLGGSALSIGNGGTGAGSATTAFNNLAPTTTTGDLIYRGISNNQRLGIGATDTVLTSDGALPGWSKILNANIDATAAIARSKLAAGTANHVVINAGDGSFSSEAALAISRGGTGQTTASAGFDALSPNTTKGDITVRTSTSNTRQAVGADGTVLTADSTQATGVKWSTISAGNGEINAVLNASAANDTTGYTAATNYSVARDTSNSPLNPAVTTALAMSTTTASSEASNSGVYYTISTMPTALRNRKLKLDLWVTVPASSAGTWVVSVRAGGTTRVPLSIDSSGVTTLPAGFTGRFQASFDADAVTTSYTVNFTQTSRTSANTLYVTNLVVGPDNIVPGAAVGEWQSFTLATPTNLGTGVVGSSGARYRRVGSQMELRAFFTLSTGGSGASTVNVALPSGFTVDSTATPFNGYSSKNVLGTASHYNGTAFQNLYEVYPASSTTLAFVKSGTAGSITGADLSSTSTEFQIHAFIPIAEWAGSGTVNLGPGAQVEYAANSANVTAANGSDTSSFIAGPNGTPFLAYNSTTANATTDFRVQFQTPIQIDDLLQLEIYNGFAWLPAETVFPYVILNTSYYGMTVSPISSTTATVSFGNQGSRPGNAATYAASGQAWSVFSGLSYRWRVRKVKASSPVGFGMAGTDGSSGLVQAGKMPGVTSASTPTAGYVGEIVSSYVTAVSTAATATLGDITSITLTAGDWDVSLAANLLSNGASISGWQIGFGLGSGTSGAGLDDGSNYLIAPISGTSNSSVSIPVYRYSLSVTTTIYFKSRATYTGGTPQVTGRLSARRVR